MEYHDLDFQLFHKLTSDTKTKGSGLTNEKILG